MSLILKIFLAVFFSLIWAVLGFFYWILILGRVVFFVGVELLSALFSQADAPDLSLLVEGSSMIYIDGFVRIYESFFGDADDAKERNPPTISSFYELIATMFIAYLVFALVFPTTFLPDFSSWLESMSSGRDVQTAQGSESGFDILPVLGGALVTLAALIFMAVIVARFEKVDTVKFVKAVSKKNILSDDHLREISDELKVSFPDLKEYIKKSKKSE